MSLTTIRYTFYDSIITIKTRLFHKTDRKNPRILIRYDFRQFNDVLIYYGPNEI